MSPLRWAAGDSTQASLCTLKKPLRKRMKLQKDFQVAVDQRIKIKGVDPHGSQVILPGEAVWRWKTRNTQVILGSSLMMSPS